MVTPANTERKKIILNIDSRDRISGDTNNFNIFLGQYADVKSVALYSAEILNSFYNVNDRNNVLKLRLLRANVLLQDVSITLPPQQYTVQQVVDYLNTNLNPIVKAAMTGYGVADAPLIFRFDANTYKISVEISIAAQQYNLLISMYDAINVNSAGKYPLLAGSTLAEVLGFIPIQTEPLINASRTAGRIVDLRGDNTFFIYCNICNNSAVNSNNTQSLMLGKIQALEAIGSTIFYRNYEHIDMTSFSINRDVNLLNISFRDREGKVIQNNEHDWSLSVILFF